VADDPLERRLLEEIARLRREQDVADAKKEERMRSLEDELARLRAEPGRRCQRFGCGLSASGSSLPGSPAGWSRMPGTPTDTDGR
jgi:hypothetical protein